MRRLAPIFSVPVLVTLVALAACNSESEGYPCSTDNGNDDCNDGLVCEKPPNPSATNAPEVCCPQSLSQATTPECSLSGQIDAGNSAPPDGSTFPEAATRDGGHDATTSDAPTDSSSSGDSSSSSSDAGPG